MAVLDAQICTSLRPILRPDTTKRERGQLVLDNRLILKVIITGPSLCLRRERTSKYAHPTYFQALNCTKRT